MTKITIKKFKKAVLGTGGVITLIAQKLGCEVGAIYKFLKRHPLMKEVLDHEDSSVTDLAENKLIKKIEEGDWKAIKFRLDRRSDKYTPKQEITSSGSQEIRISSEEAEEHIEKFLKKDKKGN